MECGSQRCIGVYDNGWCEACKLYKNEFEDNSNFVNKQLINKKKIENMKKQVLICDRCGKDISQDTILHGCKSNINIDLEFCHYGSMGGEEDLEHFELDLCDDCSRDLYYKLKNWLKEKKDNLIPVLVDTFSYDEAFGTYEKVRCHDYTKNYEPMRLTPQQIKEFIDKGINLKFE